MRDPHEAVGEREDQRGVAEGVGHHEPGDEQRRHRGEDHQPHRPLLGVDDARQPGVADPAPPQHAEHEHPFARPDHVGSAAMSAVHCVSASTKTRSKKSSSGVTVSPSRCHGRQPAGARAGVRAHDRDLVTRATPMDGARLRNMRRALLVAILATLVLPSAALAATASVGFVDAGKGTGGDPALLYAATAACASPGRATAPSTAAVT